MTLSDAGAAPLRPILTIDPLLRSRGVSLAGGCLRFSEIAVTTDGRATVLPVAAVPALYPGHADLIARLERGRGHLGGVPLDRPRILGVIGTKSEDAAAEALPARIAALVDAGADAVEIEPPGPADPATGVWPFPSPVPVVLSTPDPHRAQACGAAAWRPVGNARIAPRGLRTVLSLSLDELDFAATDYRIAALGAGGAVRDDLILELSVTDASCLAALPGLHGLGVALMLDLAHSGLARAGDCAVAAAAVLAAGAGVQILRTDAVPTVAHALSLWRAASGLEP